MRDIIPRPAPPSGGFVTGWWFGALLAAWRAFQGWLYDRYLGPDDEG